MIKNIEKALVDSVVIDHISPTLLRIDSIEYEQIDREIFVIKTQEK